MRLWTLDPKYLDTMGLIALWREGLLAKKVLEDKTKGYKNHPQLQRFKTSKDPISSINAYLEIVFNEATKRGYKFDSSKFIHGLPYSKIKVTKGQVDYELEHLISKLKVRSPKILENIPKQNPDVNTIFEIVDGGIEEWERVQQRFFCMDCKLDTWDEYYMIYTNVWKKVNPKIKGKLCITCLENRLGRKLTSVDFTKALVNTMKTERSKILQDRLR